MKVNLTKAVVISLLAHALFFSFLIYYNIQGEEPFGQEFVSVEIIGEDVAQDFSPANHVAERFSVPQEPWNPKGFRYKDGPAKTGSYDTPHNIEPLNNGTLEPLGDGSAIVTGAGDSNNTGGRTDSPGSPTGNPILAKIRNKIERSKYYPQQARLQRLEGRPEVSFKIAPNGAVGSVQLIRSSGNALLDSAAIETVNRAAPLPYYEGQISLAINFTLR